MVIFCVNLQDCHCFACPGDGVERDLFSSVDMCTQHPTSRLSNSERIHCASGTDHASAIWVYRSVDSSNVLPVRIGSASCIKESYNGFGAIEKTVTACRPNGTYNRGSAGVSD